MFLSSKQIEEQVYFELIRKINMVERWFIIIIIKYTNLIRDTKKSGLRVLKADDKIIKFYLSCRLKIF